MFERKETGKLLFKRLDFEIMIGDIIDDIKPTTKEDLEWMIAKMIDSIQLCAFEYVNDSGDIDEEWEDVFYPNF